MKRLILSWQKGRRPLVAGAFLLCILVQCSKSNQPPLAITWVSTDRVEFEPEKGEQVTLRYRVSAPALVEVKFWDRLGEAVRTFEKEVEKPGEENVSWDGRDEGGNRVPSEAYVYTISAWANGEKESTPVVYDLRDRTGGALVHVERIEWDPKSGRLVYGISTPSRVRVILGRQETGWPVGTLIDWEPRAAGRHQEPWNGWDSQIEAKEMPRLVPAIHAFALPDNAVIVKGPQSGNGYSSSARTPDKTPYRLRAQSVASNVVLHQHAHHPRSRCYDPPIEISFPEAQTIKGMVRLTEKTPLRLDLALDQLKGRVAPIPKVSVSVFVDGALVERHLEGYLPDQWVLDPTEYDPGEHVITALLAWPDDHFGVRHARILVEETR